MTVSIFNKQFATEEQALENVIDYIISKEPETITDKDLYNQLETAIKYGVTSGTVKQIAKYLEIEQASTLQVAYNLADLTASYFDN